MERVSILIEIDGREKFRVAMSPEQVEDFKKTGNAEFRIGGLKDHDQHAHAKADFYKIGVRHNDA